MDFSSSNDCLIMYHLEINIDGTKQNSIEAGFTVPGAQSALWARKTFFSTYSRLSYNKDGFGVIMECFEDLKFR